jgi:hypothetical protein
MVMNNGFKQSMFLNPSTFTSIMNPTSPTTTFRSIDNQFNDMVLKRFIFFSSLTWRRLGDGNEILVE